MTTTHSIGATGRDYSTIEAWEAATDIVLADDYVGEMYHDGVAGAATFALGSTTDRIEFAGATTTSSFFRTLKAASGEKYDPVYGTGVYLARVIGTASEAKGTAIRISEDYFVLEDLAVFDSNDPTSGTSVGIDINGVDNVRVSKCFVKWSSGYGDGTAGTAYSDAIRLRTGTTNAQVDNCIVSGGGAKGDNRGCTIGIRTDASAGTNLILHNTVLDVKGYREDIGATNRGISGTGSSGVRVVNNICVNCSTLDADTVLTTSDFYNLSTDSGYNISSDNSAGYSIGGTSVEGAIKSELFVSAVNYDLRNLSTSPASDAGLASVSTTYDFTGNDRSENFADIGAFEGYVVAFEGPITEVVSTIGAAGDYTTIAAWAAATEVHLVEENTRHIGELLGETHTLTGAVSLLGAIAEYPRNRVLRPATGAEYDPMTDKGARIVDTSTSSTECINIGERDFEFHGPVLVKCEQPFLSISFNSTGVVEVNDADNVTLDRLFVTADVLAGTANLIGIRTVGGTGGRISNCVLWGHDNRDAKSINVGIANNTAGAEWLVVNNTVWGVDHTTAASYGYAVVGATDITLINNISIGADTDYFIGSNTSRTNISGDATGNITSKTEDEVFADVDGLDFYLAAASPALEAGTDYSDLLTYDADNNKRSVPFSIGAYDRAKPHPRVPTSGRDRRCTCIKIVRLDGYTLRLTDNTMMLSFDGFDWTPFVTRPSARRTQTGLTPSDADFDGVIDSSLITEEDLLAGLYSGATVTEIIVDPRYPWAEPIGVSSYRIGKVRFDKVKWEAELGSFASRLQQKIGRVIGRTCDATLGDDRCGANVTEQSKTIESVKKSRSEFYLETLSPAADDWYAFGELLWTSGSNDGATVEVRSNELVDVNLLSQKEDLSSWTLTNCTATLQAAGGPDSNDSYIVQATAAEGTLKLQQGTWADRDEIVASIYVDRGASPSRIIRISLWQDTAIEHFVEFWWDGSAWQGDGIIEDTTWGWRLALSYKAHGTEFGDLYYEVSLGEATGERLELALPQLEENADAPTTWVDAQRQHIVLAYPTKIDMAAGDAFDIKPGCDLLFGTCGTKFSNHKNFRGFNTVPGTKKALSTPLS